MATLTHRAGPSTGRRPTNRYRPANAPRTSTRTAQPLPAGFAEPVAPRAVPSPERCEVCARIRRFERRVGQTLRRFVAVAALATLAALTAGHPYSVPSGTHPTPDLHATGAPTQTKVAPLEPSPWCGPLPLPLPGCPSPAAGPSGSDPGGSG